jgi:hypothetical protein
MATAPVTGKPLIESDRVEGTTVYDPAGNNIGSIKRLMIKKLSGRVAYSVMSFGGFLGMGSEEHPIPWSKLTYDTRLGGYRTDVTENQLCGTGPIGIEKSSCMTTMVRPTTGSGSKYRRLRHTAVLGIRNNNFFD